MYTYVLAPAPLSTTREVIVVVCQAVAQRFPQPHLPALKIWGELPVAVAIKVTGDSILNKKGGVCGAPFVYLERQISFPFDKTKLIVSGILRSVGNVLPKTSFQSLANLA